MFQNVRKGQSIYILYKEGPKIEIGEVDSVGILTPQYSVNQNYQSQYLPNKQVIDIKIKVNDNTMDLQKLPADGNIADFGNGMVISTDRDSILTELETIRSNAKRILESEDKQRQIIENATKLIEEFNPRLKQEAERNKEIDFLKSEIASMKEMMSQYFGTTKKN